MEMRRQIINTEHPRDLFSFCDCENWPGFVKVCQEQPQDCTWISPNGQTLLHFICQRRPSVESIISFLELVPDALTKADIDGCLPIHMAMTNGASHDALSLLIQAAPDSVKVPNKWGYAPFDWIWKRCVFELATLDPSNSSDNCIREGIWHTLEALIKAFARGDDEKHQTILHMVTEFKCPLALLEAILNDHAWMTTARDTDGRVPIACAAKAPQSIVSTEFIQLLTFVNPKMLLEMDNDGRVPLHLAIDSKKDWDQVLLFMVKASPDCIRIQDEVTGLYPFMQLSSKNWITLAALYQAVVFCVDIFNEGA